MKVLQVFDTALLQSGGPIEGFRRQEPVLRRHGVESELVTLDPPGSDFGELGIPVHVLGSAQGGGPGGFAAKLLGGAYRYSPALVPWLRDNLPRFDAVISHGIWGYGVLGAARAVRGTRAPHLVFVHGMMDPWFRRQYPLKHVKKQLYWSFALGRAMHEADLVLFTCEEEQRLARGVFAGGGGYRSRAIAFGTADVPARTPGQQAAFRAKLPLLGDQPYLLFLSRIHPKKGCDLLVDAFGRVASLRPDLQLVVAGPDQTGWRPALEGIAGRAGVADRVHFPGMLIGDAKFGAFHGAEAFVLPSHQENFGIVLAEALACGRPVLTTPGVNIWREIENAGAGLIAPDTLEGTERVLRAFICATDEQRATMGRQGRALFEAKFDVDQTALSLLEAVEKVRNARSVDRRAA